MILAVGVTVLVSMFAGWNSLAGQIEGLRIEMHEGDARLRQERREDVAGLRGEMGELRGELRNEMGELREELRGEMGKLREELRNEMGELRTEVRAMGHRMDKMGQRLDRMGQRIDRLTESLIYVMADMKRGPDTPDPGSGIHGKQAPKGESP